MFGQQVLVQGNVLYNVIELLTVFVRKHTLRIRSRIIKDGLVSKACDAPNFSTMPRS